MKKLPGWEIVSNGRGGGIDFAPLRPSGVRFAIFSELLQAAVAFKPTPWFLIPPPKKASRLGGFGRSGEVIHLLDTPSVTCKENTETLRGVSDKNPDNLTRRPGPMTRKKKRRSSVVEFGNGPTKVRIYTMNRKDGYPEFTLAWKEGGRRRVRSLSDMEESRMVARQITVRLSNGWTVGGEATKRDLELLRHCEQRTMKFCVTLAAAIDEWVSARGVVERITLSDTVRFYQVNRTPEKHRDHVRICESPRVSPPGSINRRRSCPMGRGGRELPPVMDFRESAHAFTEWRNGRKRDMLFLLPRAFYPPRKSRDHMTRIRTPAEPEGSLSPHAFRFPPVLFT